jgi:hypothetical protein
VGTVGDAVMPFPIWMPELIEVSPWTADTFTQLYAVFQQELAPPNQLRLDGRKVTFFPDMDDGKEKMFWHLTHREDYATKVLMPELQRCARLSWVASMLSNAHQPEVIRWDYSESNGNLCTYLWLKDHDYVVILKKFPSGDYRLITAHCVDVSIKRSTLESKYKKRIV